MDSCTTSATATNSDCRSSDVFENQAKLDAFGAKLVPILQELGIQANATISPIYNIIEGP